MFTEEEKHYHYDDDEQLAMGEQLLFDYTEMPEDMDALHSCPACKSKAIDVVYTTTLGYPFVIIDCGDCHAEWLITVSQALAKKLEQMQGEGEGKKKLGELTPEELEKALAEAKAEQAQGSKSASELADEILAKAMKGQGKDGEEDGEGKDGQGKNGKQPDIDEYLKKLKYDAKLKLTEKDGQEQPGTPGFGASGIIHKGENPNDGLDGNEDKYNPAYDIIDPVTLTTFRQKVEMVLRDNSFDRLVGGRRRGALHTKALYKVTTGSDRIFAQRQERQNKEYNVLLVVDLSGSMHGDIDSSGTITDPDAVARLNKYTQKSGVSGLGYGDANGFRPTKVALALAITYLITRSLSRTGINMGVFGFNQKHIMIKDWNKVIKEDDFRKLLMHCNKYGGDNHDVLAMHDAYDMIRKAPTGRSGFRPENNIIITLSDGAIAGSGGDISLSGKSASQLNISCTEETMKAEVRKLATMGNVFGVGIFNNAVERYYPHHVVVNSGKEFASSLVSFIQKNVKLG